MDSLAPSPRYRRRREVADRLRACRSAIAEAATREFLERHPDWLERYGDRARVRGEEDAGFHLDFLGGALLADDPDAFRAYARWTAGVLAARGIDREHLAENLEQVGRLAAAELDEDAARGIRSLVEAGIAGARSAGDAEGQRGIAQGLQAERDTYLQAIRSGDRRAALAVALEALRTGRTVADVYRDILQPAQYELGRLWEANVITVAQEHMATAVTQYVAAQLYGHLEISEVRRGRAIVTGVRGELHQIGANMVADVLDADGWDTRFLGTQLPHSGVLHAIEEHEARLLGVSATVLFNLNAVGALIEEVRASFGSALTVIVGGSAFPHGNAAWREMGADGYGRDLRHAVAVARQLTEAKEPS